MILILNRNRKIIKLPGRQGMKIFFACAGEFLISFVRISLKMVSLMLVVILLVLKLIFVQKIILPGQALQLTGSMLLKDNGCFINCGEDYCTILPLPMLSSRQSLPFVMAKVVAIY